LTEEEMAELREISDSIVDARKKLRREGNATLDNYDLSTKIQSLARRRKQILGENPLDRIDHPDPDSLPPFQRADPEYVRELAKAIISNPDPNAIKFKRL